MGRKAKHPEHENLERWMVSYADFVTLLFATFVVLYALSQVDIKDFKALEQSIKQAFSAPSIMQGKESIMDASSDTLFDSQQADSMITPLMMEYMSQKYEEESMQSIEKAIEQDVKQEGMQGVQAFETDRGLVIRFDDDYLFKPGSAALLPNSKANLDKIGAEIARKFILHNMRIEGHTDNQPMKSTLYPSNWELSSARSSTIIRYFIDRFAFMPSIFTAIGFADTRPIADNSTTSGRAKNRRVEILILKNKFKSSESPTNDIMKMSKEEQQKMQNKRMETINRIDSITKQVAQENKQIPKVSTNEAFLNAVYSSETKRISKESQALDSSTRAKITGQGGWLKPPAPSK
jgi:chemotaxis protein MotB